MIPLAKLQASAGTALPVPDAALPTLTGDELRRTAAQTLRTAVTGWTMAIETALRAAVTDEATCTSSEFVPDWAQLRPGARPPLPAVLAWLADDFGNRFGMRCEMRADGTLRLSWGDEPQCACHDRAIGRDKRASLNFCARHGCGTCKTVFPAGSSHCGRCGPAVAAIVEEGAERAPKRARTQE